MQTAKFTAFVFALSLVTTACGDSMSSLNPTAPSAVAPDSVNVEAGAAGAMGNGPKPGHGNGNGNGNGNNGGGNGNGTQPALTTTTLPSSTVQIEGVVSAVGTASITVNGQLVAVGAETVIRKGALRLKLSDLRAGDRVHVSARRAASTNSAATLEATEIKRQNAGDSVEGEEPPPTPTGLVSVTALDANAVEGAVDSAAFRLTRTGDASLLTSALTVSFTLTGAAANGTDYAVLATTATIPANATTVDVVVSATLDNAAEGSEDVVLTLTGAAPYELGSPLAATATIADPPAPAGPTVTVTATDGVANEDMDLFDFAGYSVTRTGDSSVPLTVTLSFGGTATSGVDYQTLDTTVHFAAGSASVNFAVIANPDGVADPDETVVVTVEDGPGYDPGTPASATIRILGS